MLHRCIAAGCLATLAGCVSTVVPDYQQSLQSDHVLSKEEQHVINESTKLTDEIAKKGLIVSDPDARKLIDRTASRLISSGDILDSVDIYILRSPEINAFATGNSKIYIQSGIFSILESEGQLAALMAHEIAHVLERHNVKGLINIKKSVSAAKIANFFTLGLATLPALSSISNHTQESELEADRRAVGMLVDAGYPPGDILKLFDNLKHVSGRKQQIRGFWATHPTSRERSQQLEELISASRAQPKGDLLNNEEQEFDVSFKQIRAERIRANIKMRLRAKQYQLALEDIAVFEHMDIDLQPGKLDFYRGEAYFGLSKHTKSAARERSIIEFGTAEKWFRYKDLLDKEIPMNREKAKSHYQASLDKDSGLLDAMLQLGDLAVVEKDNATALKWYEEYRSQATNERDKEYASRLINKIEATPTDKE